MTGGQKMVKYRRERNEARHEAKTLREQNRSLARALEKCQKEAAR